MRCHTSVLFQPFFLAFVDLLLPPSHWVQRECSFPRRLGMDGQVTHSWYGDMGGHRQLKILAFVELWNLSNYNSQVLLDLVSMRCMTFWVVLFSWIPGSNLLGRDPQVGLILKSGRNLLFKILWSSYQKWNAFMIWNIFVGK